MMGYDNILECEHENNIMSIVKREGEFEEGENHGHHHLLFHYCETLSHVDSGSRREGYNPIRCLQAFCIPSKNHCELN